SLGEVEKRTKTINNNFKGGISGLRCGFGKTTSGKRDIPDIGSLKEVSVVVRPIVPKIDHHNNA
ncbi:hypothetical protein N9Z27_01120, partial [Alphaproteobacteria bacterium]|nr:hypothetical protein [Alphaproteobacteria bacterium]